MKYRKGYKYTLAGDEHYETGWFIGKDIETDFIKLTRAGHLIVKMYYAWDGCSGPTIDTKSNMRAGLFHDAICQLIRLGLLEPKYLSKANEMLKKVMIEDKAFEFRAKYYQYFVTKFGGFAAKPGYEPYPILEAP